MSIVFVFLDGVGLAEASDDNCLARASFPHFESLFGGPLLARPAVSAPDRVFRAVDACMGVDGLPQSGTGQTALYAGFNAAAAHGRHQPYFPPVALRERLANENIFGRVRAAGASALLANTYGPGYWRALETRRLRRSASVVAAEGAGLRLCDLDDFRAGRSMAWDLSGMTIAQREQRPDLPAYTPEESGQILAHLATQYDLVVYENFLPDLAGHGRVDSDLSAMPELLDLPMIDAQVLFAMHHIDRFLGAACAALRPSDTLVICSDHGNIESRAEPTHTRNPVPLCAYGSAAAAFANVESIVDVADAIMVAFQGLNAIAYHGKTQ